MATSGLQLVLLPLLLLLLLPIAKPKIGSATKVAARSAAPAAAAVALQGVLH
jgi:hypothetical protein